MSYLKTIISGGLSGMIAGFLTTPFDVIKTRMMTNVTTQYKITPIRWLRKIVTEEGYAALFKGWHVRIIYLSMGGIVYFLTYVTALKMVGAGKKYSQLRE